ncbi:MAG: XRE family transcriptional regulator [Proteobacteria bacterium]|jgi:SOS-response transcriptional repressor LexA|nr:XRE family transcriptional regulator [Pseudomonadota bacterium]
MAIKEIEELNSTRIENTKKLINDKYLTLSNLAKALDKSVSYLSHLLAGNRTFTEKTAREVESVLGLQSFSLDQNAQNTHINVSIYNSQEFHPILAKSIIGFNRDDLLVVYASDDAMSPIVEFGQGVVFDKTQINVNGGRVYVILINDNIVVRRIFKDILTNKLTLKSENNKYTDIILENQNQIEILGLAILSLEKLIN